MYVCLVACYVSMYYNVEWPQTSLPTYNQQHIDGCVHCAGCANGWIEDKNKLWASKGENEKEREEHVCARIFMVVLNERGEDMMQKKLIPMRL